MKLLPALRGKSLVPYDASSVTLSSYYSDLWGAINANRSKPWPVERAVSEGFERVIWVFKAVDTISGDAARLPFRLKQNGETLKEHPLYDILNKRANPLETGQVFRKRLSAQILLSKRGAFVEVSYTRGGLPYRMDLLPPGRVEIIPGSGDNLVRCFRLTRRNGSTRDIEPDRVRWFRNPHPLDPYSGVTPLEAMGMSVELDHFARLYNVQFLRNDGRPGGILGIRAPSGPGASGDMGEKEMDRVESRFGKGPVEAGKLSVISGELSYVDVAAKPRDMAYGALSRNSKIEILSGFGVAESVLGYAAERTFDNAEQELYNYWTRTMPEHTGVITTGFDEDSDDGLEGFLDTTDVEVLQRAGRAIRVEAREEFAAGLRSIVSYAKLAGFADEIESTPHTRALYIAQGKTPLPASSEDAAALGLEQPSPDQGALPPGGGAPAAIEGGHGAAALADAQGGDQAGASTSDVAATAQEGSGAALLRDALAAAAGNGGGAGQVVGKSTPKGRAVLRLVETKKAPPSFDSPDEVETKPDLVAWQRLEDQLAAILTTQVLRWTERAVARIESPKQRKGTRHWTAEHANDTRVGTKALDAVRAVDSETWATEAESVTLHVIQAAAIAAAAAVLVDLADTPRERASRLAPEIVGNIVRQVTGMVTGSATRMAGLLVTVVNDADQRGETVDMIVQQVREFSARLANWGIHLAADTAAATINGARDAASAQVAYESDGRRDVIRFWETRRDVKVRDSHRETRGQTRKIGEPFVVGESLLRFPGDPLAPPHERINCRCWLVHRSVASGKFIPKPVAVAAAI